MLSKLSYNSSIRHKNFLLCLFILFIFSSLSNLHAQSQAWYKVGEYGFSPANTDNLKGTISPDGTPYLVSNTNGADGRDFEVFKFNGSHWESLGGYNHESIYRARKFGIKVAADGTIYVSAQYLPEEMGGYGTNVYKYSGSGWTEIADFGDSGSPENKMNTEIIIGSDGSPFLFNRYSYHDIWLYQIIKVRKYNGTIWSDIGTYSTTGELYNESFALASDDTPYLFFRYWDNPVYKAKVVKYNGSTWVDVGAAFTADRVADAGTGIALNSLNTPYVFFRDNNNSSKGTVMLYNGSNWVPVGTEGFTTGSTDYNSIVFTNDVPYVFFKDAGISKATAMKFDGSSWVNVGTAGFSPGTVDRINGDFSYPNSVTIPIVFFKDNNAGGRKSVMKFSQKNITVTSPNGGEYWKPNSTHNITWTSSTITNVKIEYSTNNGTDWTTVVASTPADAGAYPWVTPSDEYMRQCRVKVSDVDNPTIVLYSDGSDAVFSVTNYFAINIGTGTATNENLPIRTDENRSYSQQIYTQSQLNRAGDIKSIVFKVSGSTGNSNSWDVYMGHTTKTEFTSNTDWVPVSSMTQVFSGDVTYPPSQGVLVVTLPTPFTYNTIDNLVIAVRENKAGEGDNLLTWDSFTSGANTGIFYYDYFDFILNPPPTALGRTNNINKIDVLFEDPIPSITVVAPNGGENWAVGSSKNITWEKNLVDNVKIEYTTNGSDWNTIVASAPATSYSWTIPNEISANCKVRVSDASNLALYDESNSLFSIVAPFLTVTAPNGGESWNIGTANNITWTSDGFTNVKIEYSTNNGSGWIVISASTTASLGTYSWTVPNTPSANCLVKISDAADGTPSDQSNATFTLTSPSVRVRIPNGGESWAASTKNNITWTYNSVDNIKIEYTTNNGSDWNEIIASTPAAAGSYEWTVPNAPSALCKVRISDVSMPSIIDASNKTFTIEAAPPAPANTVGYALLFDGTDDFVQIPDANALDLTGNYTLQCWIKANSFSGRKGIISKFQSAGANGYFLRLNGTELEFDNMTTSGLGLQTNVWYHIAAVKSGTTRTLYVNGEAKSLSGTALTTAANTNYLSIGADYNVAEPNARIFDGYIDEVNIWSFAFAQLLVKSYMYKFYTGSEGSLTAYYKMSNGSGTTLTDNKTNGTNHGTLQNGPLWKSSDCLAGPKFALNFDGTDDYVQSSFYQNYSQFTYECWVKGDVAPGSSQTCVISRGTGIQINWGHSDPNLRGAAAIQISGTWYPASFGTLEAGIWYHLAVTYDGENLRTYKNGVLVTTNSDPSGTPGSSEYFYIGRNRDGGCFFDGTIDEVRIWYNSRTESQIRENMMNTLTATESGLALYFRNDYTGGTTTYNVVSYDTYNGSLNGFTVPGCWVASTSYNTWIGGVDGSWSTASNWSLGTVPSATDNVGLYYWSAGGNECTISSTPTVNNLFISPLSNPTLGSDIVVNGSLVLQRDIDLSGRTISIGSSGYLNEGTRRFFGTSGTIQTTRTLNNISNENVGGLGFVITSAADLGSTLITRGHTVQTAGENEGINRYYNVTPSTNTGLNATATYYYNEAELNGIEEADLILFKSTDNGTNWTNMGGTVSAENNRVSLSGIDGFSRWTLGSYDSPLPVELNTFSAKSTKNLVTLNWETKTEVDNYGFEVERTPHNPPFDNGGTQGGWETIGFVAGSGNSNSPKSYSFKDNTPRIGKVLYRLKQIDNDGTFSYSDVVEVEVALPAEFKLEQNYPNPFNPTTKIEYQLPLNSHVKLELYSITGEKISTLVNDELEAGYYTLILNASELKLASGVYFYRLISNDYTSIKKMLLLK